MAAAAWAALGILNLFGANVVEGEPSQLWRPYKTEICPVPNTPDVVKCDEADDTYVRGVLANTSGLVASKSDTHLTGQRFGTFSLAEDGLRQRDPKLDVWNDAHTNEETPQDGGRFSEILQAKGDFAAGLAASGICLSQASQV